ncbi:3-oxoacyl-[acyl-carrier-protein] synthase III C-terminal domain-containing protein [Azotobacter chroococcum]|uniref:3-oxoacyl-[acyl-carrier-protein] synthase III C-terminal domain-containing protein n=1 Tax=Azotobacter chroococcum TaxID=353 RepID=UPI0010AE3347|nr:3-oxoacyl-[acyl-carrier-protein] synthase III C-terminal domain-containing protein [Azotobacter chroococcum]TKD45509.1 type III polyketide synthase [Azotobacter chroococcum]
MNDMVNPNGAVLTGFTPVQMAKPIPQRITLELTAYAFAKAHCLNHGITDEESFLDVYKTVKEKFDKYAVSPAQIKQRQLVYFPKLTDIRFGEGTFDVADPEPEEAHLRVFDIKKDPRGADLKVRHESFARVVEEGVERMYAADAPAPDDLIHVTCTGYLSPSPVEHVVSRRKWFETTVTHSYAMGCYGAFPAIKMAHGMLVSSRCGVTPIKHRVDIVHTELMSAHNNITEWRADNIISATLFSDGLIKYSVLSEEELRRQGLRGLRILAMSEHLLPDSTDTMTGVPGPYQYVMTLSPLVPVIIKRHVRAFVVDLLRRAGMDFERDKDALSFAVHPGGPKIVEHVQEELDLSEDQVVISKGVFFEHGNMSSSTIPHILMQHLEEATVGTRIVCLGFGPGLTITGLVLEKI